MIKKISFRKLSHNELITLCLRLITAIEAVATINTGFVAKVLPILIEFNKKFVLAVNRSQKNAFTDILKAKDKRRDDAFRSIRDVVLGYARCLNDIKRTAAKRLLEIFKRNNWTLYIDGYQEESAELNQLISEMENKESQDSIKTLNINDLYDDIKSTQKDFEDAFYSKANETTKEDYAIITEIRPKLMSNLTDLLQRIGSDAKFADDGNGYKELLNTINNILTETDTIAKSRITRGNGNDDLPESDEPDELAKTNGVIK
jgi:hypothetical protein